MKKNDFTRLAVYTTTAQDIKAWIESQHFKVSTVEAVRYLIELGIKHSPVCDEKKESLK